VQTQFSVEVHEQGRGTVIALSGELDLASSPALEEAFERVFSADDLSVVIDLRKLEFMDSTGLSIIVKAHQTAEERDLRLYVVNGPPQVQRLLSLTGVAERVSLVGAPEDVLGGS
jgi:anti-sigma B factor antagonist